MSRSWPDLADVGLMLEDELGRGATSVVYRARQVEMANRPVAVKVFGESIFEATESLEREIAATTELRHPNVVSVYGGRTGAAPRYLVLELAERKPPSLPLSLPAVIGCGIKLSSALALAHEANIVHSDVKPDNILWHRGTEPLLSDFGTACIRARTTFRHDLGFTPGWSPRWMGARPADAGSDVWSLAASLIWLHWGWEPSLIRWGDMSPDLVTVFRQAMPERPEEQPLGTEPALAFGRLLQQVQHRRSWSIASFPRSEHVNWSPSPQHGETVSPGELRSDAGGPAAAPAVTVTDPAEVPTAEVPTAGGAATGQPGSGGKRPASRWRRRRRSGLGLVAVALIGGGGLAAYRLAEDLGAAVGADGSAAGTTGPDSVGSSSTVGTDGEVPGRIEPEPGSSDPLAEDRDGGGEASSATSGEGVSSTLVFASDRSGDLDIYRRRPDGKVEPIVERTGIDDYSPSLSPDGARVVFESNDGGTRAVYVVPTDGSAEPRRISPDGSEAAEPAWSPDGLAIAWSSRARGNWDIVLHDLESETETFVVVGLSDDRNPSWSPDGTALVFRSDRTGDGDIYALDLDDQSLKHLTSEAALEDQPDWGPGDLVAFERRRGDDVEVYTVGLDAGEPVRRTDHLGFDGSPTFDGSRLIVVRHDGGTSSIVVDPDGDEITIHESAGLTQDLRSS